MVQLPVLLSVTVAEEMPEVGSIDWLPAALYQVASQLVEFRASQSQVEMFGTGRRGCDERERYRRFTHGRQFDLRLFGGFHQPLKSLWILLQIDAFQFFEFTR